MGIIDGDGHFASTAADATCAPATITPANHTTGNPLTKFFDGVAIALKGDRGMVERLDSPRRLKAVIRHLVGSADATGIGNIGLPLTPEGIAALQASDAYKHLQQTAAQIGLNLSISASGPSRFVNPYVRLDLSVVDKKATLSQVLHPGRAPG